MKNLFNFSAMVCAALLLSSFSVLAQNPVPAIDLVTPTAIAPGGPAVELTVRGANFVPGSKVLWNGHDRTEGYVGPNELRATILATDIASPTTGWVTVKNPQPGGGESAVSFVHVSVTTGPLSFDRADYSIIQPLTGTALNPQGVIAADFNGDRILDLATANAGGSGCTVSVLLGIGGGLFGEPKEYRTCDEYEAFLPQFLVSGDFNNDGNLDLAVTHGQGARVVVILGKPDGTFDEWPNANACQVGTAPAYLSVGDLNRDGKLDLAIANAASNTASICLGNGDGTFVPQPHLTAPSGAYGVTIADVNSDGMLDVVVAGPNTGNVRFYPGTGDGGFGTYVDLSAGDHPEVPLMTDFNGDGLLDLLVANAYAGTVTVFPGGPNSTFGMPSISGVGSIPAAVDVGDFNADGKQDFVVGNFFSQNATVYLGLGDANFNNRLDVPTGDFPQGVVVGDFNNDGKLDFATANTGPHTVSVFLNTSFASNQSPQAKTGPNQVVECCSSSGTPVTLTGADSFDPDGDSLSFSWTDQHGNAIGTDPVVTISLPLGTHIFTLTVNDGRGGFSTAQTTVIVQDTLPPTLTLSTASITVVVPTATASDAMVDLTGIGSAVDLCDPSVTISNDAPTVFPIGRSVVTFTAADHSGNSTAATLEVVVRYSFVGFLSPIRSDGSSVFRSGRTIPIKFQLKAADGTYIGNASATLSIFRVTDQVLGTVEEITPDAPGAANTGNQFSYDPSTQQYFYNLRTTWYQQGTYILRATVSDGTVHEVFMSIRN